MEKYIFSFIGVLLFILYLLTYNIFMAAAFPMYPKYDGNLSIPSEKAYIVTTDKENLKDPDYVTNLLNTQVNKYAKNNNLDSNDTAELSEHINMFKENYELIYLEKGLYTINSYYDILKLDYGLNFASNPNISTSTTIINDDDSYDDDLDDNITSDIYNINSIYNLETSNSFDLSESYAYNIPIVNNMILLSGRDYDNVNFDYKKQLSYGDDSSTSINSGFKFIKPGGTISKEDINLLYTYNKNSTDLNEIIKDDNFDYILPDDLTFEIDEDNNMYTNTSDYIIINYSSEVV